MALNLKKNLFFKISIKMNKPIKKEIWTKVSTIDNTWEYTVRKYC